MTIISRNIRRTQAPSKAPLNDGGLEPPVIDKDEKVKVSVTDLNSGYLFDKIIGKEGRQTVIQELINKDGEQFLKLTAELYWGNTLVVSSFGDDLTGGKEQLGRHFRTLKRAVEVAGDNDCIFWLGQQDTANPISVSSKSVFIYALNASFAGTAGSTLFNVTNNGHLTIKGHLTIDAPNCTLATVNNGSSFLWDGGALKSCRLGVHSFYNSSAQLCNLSEVNFPTITNKVGVFRLRENCKLKLKNIGKLTVESPTEYFAITYNADELELDNIESIQFKLDSFINNFSPTTIKVRFCNLADMQFLKDRGSFNKFGSMYGSVDFSMENCQVTSYMRLLRTEGKINIRNSRIIGLSGDEPIDFTQTLEGSEITNCTIDSPARALVYQNTVGSLLVAGNYLRKSFIPNDNIKAYDNHLLDGEEVDLGETTSSVFNIDFSLGRVIFITLTQDVTLTFENIFKGVDYSLVFIQDSVGNHNVTLPAECQFAGSGGHPSFNYPAFFVVKMQLRFEKIGDRLHCGVEQYGS